MTFLLQLLIAVSIIIALAKLAGSLSAAVGQPPVSAGPYSSRRQPR